MTESLVRKRPKIAGKKCKHLGESLISWVTEDHLSNCAYANVCANQGSFLFRQCYINFLVHIKDLESENVKVHTNRSSSLPQKTLLLKCLINSPAFKVPPCSFGEEIQIYSTFNIQQSAPQNTV